MRLSLLALFVAAPTLGGCASSQYWLAGTVDYAVSPSVAPEPGASGALPLTVLYCPALVDYQTSKILRPPFVQFGDGCVLDVADARGTCDLPTSTGALRIRVDTVSAAFTEHYRARSGVPFNLVVGGRSGDGSRYVTYRFTGTEMTDGTHDDCEAAARSLPGQEG